MSQARALFQSHLREAVHAAQAAAAPSSHPQPGGECAASRVEVLARLARGEITIDQALHALERAP
jgi:hypothetical protein